MSNIPFFTVCIPAYNRAQFLAPLLESVFAQEFIDFDILIHEDFSPQRADIGAIVEHYMARYPNRITYTENVINLGYDANLRSLLEAAAGRYCFFMGNDDVMATGALQASHAAISRHPDVGVIIRSYSWFKTDPSKPVDTIRYFAEERFFPAGADTISTFFRRTGVLSGFIISTEKARAVATDKFDGFLYYQMYLTASVLAYSNGVFTPVVLTLSRDTEPPDFGNSLNEKDVFRPGGYTPEARIHMLTGMLTIAAAVELSTGVTIQEKIKSDIGNYIYPYIRDQLDLSPIKYYRYYKSLCNLGLCKNINFYIIIIIAYILKTKSFDFVVGLIRKILGRTPQLGKVYGGIIS